VGALLVLGSTGLEFFARRGFPVEAAARYGHPHRAPGECPPYAAGVRLESPPAQRGRLRARASAAWRRYAPERGTRPRRAR
jgi:hypothetical protein